MSKAADALTRRNLLFTIGACDWSIGFRGRTEALALAKQLGLDGTESLDLPIKVVRAFRR